MGQLSAVLLALVTFWTASGQTYTISTFAGGALPVNIAGTSASLYYPTAVAVDKAGNVFLTDFFESIVLRLDATTGVLTLAAGNGTQGFSGDDGLATSAQLNGPNGVAVDSAGTLYISDGDNFRIRRVSNGVITTVAGNGSAGVSGAFAGDNGPATSAQLFPSGVAVDAAGNLYISDFVNRIRKVANGVITTVAGNGTQGLSGDNGPATSAQLYYPAGVAVDAAGNLYIADSGNNRIRKVSNGVITTVAGSGLGGFGGDNGPATSALLAYPVGIAVDAAGNFYIGDFVNRRVRKVTNGLITTVVGNGAFFYTGDNVPATSAGLSTAGGVAVDSGGNLYIADSGSYRIRKVANLVITTVAGNGTSSFSADNGPATSAQLNTPYAVAMDSAGSLYISDPGNNRVRKVSNGVITTFAQLDGPAGVAVDAAGNLYIAQPDDSRVLKVANGVITTVAGNGTAGFSGDNGPATSARLNGPAGVAVDAAGNLYIADSGNNRIRKVATGVITTVAGNGTETFSGDNGPAISAQLNPADVAVDTGGNLYIADTFNNRIRKVSNGVITTVAGNGAQGFSGDNGPATDAQLYDPKGVVVDFAGDLYIADFSSNRIRKVSNGAITTVAGSGLADPSGAGFSGDNGPATSAQLNDPLSVAVDSGGNLYIADYGNYRIRLLTPGTIPAVTKGGVVPVYSSVPVIQPGSLVSIYGSDLASGTFLWNGDFPTSLGGVSVTIDNKPAYLWTVSPFQINLQVPDDNATGPVSVAVTTASGTGTSAVTLAPYGPSFSLLGDGKHVAGEIATPNGTGAYGTYDLVGPPNTFSFSTRPVKAGETLTLYGVGFGPTIPHVPAGQIFSGAASTNTPVTIGVGGVNANVSFAGITEAGLYQFNLTVPPNTGSGDQAIQATVNGVQTPPGPVVTVQ